MPSSRPAVDQASVEIPVFTQEDVLALLGWRSEGSQVLDKLEGSYFTQPGVGGVDYRRMAEAMLSFWKQFNAPPGDHLYDLLLPSLPENSRAPWMEVLNGLKEIAPRLNVLYVEERLLHFLHHANLRSRIYAALRQLQGGKLEEAEETLSKPGREIVVSTPLSFASVAQLESYLVSKQEARFLSGISEFDKLHIGPGRKELFIVMAPPKRGKSWWLIHIAKFALLSHFRVLHVTLEMAKEQVLQRYVQSLSGLPKRYQKAVRGTRMLVDDAQIVRALEFDVLGDFQGLITDEGRLNKETVDNMQKFAARLDLRVEEYPMRTITPSSLEACMDRLERREHFIPDMLVVDYGDLFKMDVKNLRVEVGAVFQELRAIGQRRNIAVVTATQTNRGGSKAKLVTDFDAAEDYSKVMTADWLFTYTQSPVERKLNTARIFCSNGRDENDKQLVVVTQNYALGQFCLDSARLPDDWQAILSPYSGTEGDDHANS